MSPFNNCKYFQYLQIVTSYNAQAVCWVDKTIPVKLNWESQFDIGYMG
jgi:hypothetical protein